MDTRPVVISPLKGEDQRWPSRAPSATRIVDMWYDGRGAWSSAGGYRRIIRGPVIEVVTTNPFRNIGPIESIHWVSRHNGACSDLIYIDGADGVLYVFNPSTAARTGASPGDVAKDRTGTAITRSIISTPWQRHQSACWGDILYLVNGIDRPLAWNGYFWDYAGFPTPPAPPSVRAMAHPHATDSGTPTATKLSNVGIGPTSVTAGTDYKVARRYRVSFVNTRGQESPLSEPSDVISFTNTGGGGTGDGAHFGQVGLPVGPSSTVARNVYCTQNLYDSSGTLVVGRDTEFFRHSQIQDNATATLMDSTPDGFLGALVDPWRLGVWPSDARLLAPFKGCMFVSGTNSSAVYFSAVGQPEVFPPDNVIDVGDAILGPVTGMYATRNALVVFKARGVYLIKGDPERGFYAETLTKETGCAAPNTIREVPGQGVFFVSDHAIHCLVGALANEGTPTTVVNVSEPIASHMRRINKSALLNACAAVYHRDREVWFCLPMVGSANPNLVLVWHYEVKEWSERPYFPVSCILETPEQGHLLFGSWADSIAHSDDGIAHKGIHVYSRGWADKDGTAISPLYETGKISVGNAYRTFSPKHVLVSGILHGDNDLTVNVRPNASQVLWFGTGLTGENPLPSADQQYPQEPVPVYGTATYDTADVLWQQWRDGTMRFEVAKASFVLECSIILKPQSGQRWMTLLALSLEIAPGDPAPMKPLRPDGAA